jgi:hypothetical protein
METVRTISFLLLLWAQSADAQNRPDWVNTPHKEDAHYKYYVGRSSEAHNEAVGFQEATQDGYEQAIRENYGVTTRVNAETYESEKERVLIATGTHNRFRAG